ncbi:MAG: hypothetical protein WCH99_11055 [Verrucomicrobiota bacterium]
MLRVSRLPQFQQKNYSRVIVKAAFWLIFLAYLALAGVSVNAAGEKPRDKPATKSTEMAKPNTFTQSQTLAELLALKPDELEKVDIGLIDLLCAEGLRGSEDLNVQQSVKTLDILAEHVKAETERNR